jgi:hypothetical protein
MHPNPDARRFRHAPVRADGVDYLLQAEKDIARMEQLGFGNRCAWQDPPVADPTR